ncbi:MAG: Ppx/GppA phosphatase family protein [Cyanobacteria bacterium P01_D01_bin.44]
MVDTVALPALSMQPASISAGPSRDRTLAAIDVGTNSVHMVIVKIQPQFPSFTIIGREKDMVRLGNFCEKTGNLTDEAMDRCVAALQRCLQIAQSANVEETIAVATSAAREAKNGQAFIDRVKAELGLAINLISGPEEARRIYLGVLSSMELHGQPHGIIDIGGGSTELILGTGDQPRFLSSTKIGAVRLNAKLITTNPISHDEFIRLQAYVRGMIEPSSDDLKRCLEPGESLRLIGTSGTIETLAMLCAVDRLGSVPDPLNGFEMTYKELSHWVERLSQMRYAERLELSEMSERRAEIIVPGAVILQETMKLLDVDKITICEAALREGVVVDWMLSHGLIEDRMQYQQSIRERSVITTAQKYRVDMPHCERVGQFAVALFDQTQGVLHPWGDAEREYLWAAAMLHNCGHYISHSAHHKHSYYLIRNGELLGFTELELELIANIARYHRKSAPKKKHESYRDLPTKRDRERVEQLSAMLRVAVALDRRRVGAIASFQSVFNDAEHTLTLHIHPTHPDDDCDLELWNLDFKKACFEEEFKVKLEAKLF